MIFAALSVLLQVFVPYRRYSPILKWLTLVLFLYVGVVFTVDIPWREVALGTLLPKVQFTPDYLMLLVAVFGTTISPYLFFWQAAQEVEEMRRQKKLRPLNTLSRGGDREMQRIGLDTSVGMIFSNAIAFFIMLTTAATLHANGVTNIQTAADAANALRPIAGELAFLLFALGIIGTGLLAIPVLAGSAAYAVAEFYEWPSSLEAKLPRAVGFYGIIAAATLIGFGLTFTPLRPDPHADLERGDQRRRRGSDHGHDDADRHARRDHGPLCRQPAPHDRRLGRHRIDGGDRDRDADIDARVTALPAARRTREIRARGAMGSECQIRSASPSV